MVTNSLEVLILVVFIAAIQRCTVYLGRSSSPSTLDMD